MSSSSSEGTIRGRRAWIARFYARLAAEGLIRWAALFAGVLVFGWIAQELHRTSVVFFDAPVMELLYELRSTTTTVVMRTVTRMGDGWFLAGVGIAGGVLLGARHHPRSAAFLASSALGGMLLNFGLKAWFARDRPDVLLRIDEADGLSFPSGHSMSSAAVYGAVAILAIVRFPRHRWLLVGGSALVVVAIGLSRAYLHVHYPSDVLAGWALGLAWPLWLKPLVLGAGYRPERVPRRVLEADGITVGDSPRRGAT